MTVMANATTPNGAMTMLRTFSDLLWHERDLLESLRYRLEVEHLLLGAGRTELLPVAVREVEDVLAAVRKAELARATELATTAAELGLPDGASLLELAAAAPPPWDGILREHRTAFLTLTSEIAAVSESNRDLLMATHHATQETLMALHETVDVYDSRGSTSRGTAAHVVDKAL